MTFHEDLKKTLRLILSAGGMLQVECERAKINLSIPETLKTLEYIESDLTDALKCITESIEALYKPNGDLVDKFPEVKY